MDDPVIEDPLTRAIRRAQAGDVAAFEVLVRELERPLRAWITVQSPPGVDVDELAQRSFVSAYTRLADFKPGTNFRAWLFAIARYQLRSETTRLRRIAEYHARYAPEALLDALHARDEEPAEFVEERLDHLRQCVQTLSDTLRRFLKWRYEEEASLGEIADRSGRSLPAVKKQLWKLRRNLQECVEARVVAEGRVS